jgi:RHS repeat-associated protein
VRWRSGASVTDFGFTGQRLESGFGLMDYNARYYSPRLGRFVSADTVIPGAGNPLAWDRYAYTNYNPVKYVDPSGHIGGCPPFDFVCSLDYVHTTFVAPNKDVLHSALSTTGTVLQDLASGVDSIGTGLEFGGLLAGGPAGALAGNLAYMGTLNKIEGVFSWGSTAVTILDDWVVDGRVDSEASALSLLGSIIGQVVPIATIDLLIDGYLSGYNHNAFPGIISSVWMNDGKYAYEDYKLLPESEPEHIYLPVIINNQNSNSVYLPIIAK